MASYRECCFPNWKKSRWIKLLSQVLGGRDRPLDTPPEEFAMVSFFSVAERTDKKNDSMDSLSFSISSDLCVNYPLLILLPSAASLAKQSFFSYSYHKSQESYARQLQWADGSFSDCIALLRAYRQWEKCRTTHQFRRRKDERDWALWVDMVFRSPPRSIDLRRVRWGGVQCVQKNLSSSIICVLLALPMKKHSEILTACAETRVAEPESEVFGCSRIPSNTGSRSRIFVRLRMPNWIIFLHHTPKLGIPVEMVQFLLKLLLNQSFLAVHHDFHWF